jgi:tetratricopeptide (TPR) repeat protein
VLPDGPVAGSGIEPVTAPPSGPPAGDEPHGLGWLLSQSGLGATSPVPIEAVAEEPESEPGSGPEPASEPGFGPDSEPGSGPESELGSGPAPEPESERDPEPAPEPEPQPVVEDSAPVSGAPQKQNWFVPVTGSQPIITPAGTEDESPDDEPVAAELVGEPIVAEVVDEPIDAELVDEPVGAAFFDEPVDAVVLEDEPAADDVVAAPISAMPANASPVSVAPVNNTPADTYPVSAVPVSATPISPTPVSATPISATPVSATPVSVAPVEPETAGTESVGTDLAEADAVEAELVDIEPVDAMWVEAELPPTVEDHLEPAAVEPLAPPVIDQASDQPEPAYEPDTHAEPQTETHAEPQTETHAEPQTEPETHAEPGTETEAHAERQTEPDTDDGPEDETEAHAEPRDEPQPAAENEDDAPPTEDDAAPTEDDAAPATVGLMADSGRPEPDDEDTDVEREAPSGRDAEPSGTVPLVRSEARKLIRQRAQTAGAAGNRRADPEQVLANYPWAFDTATLRERIDDPDQMWVVVDRLTDKLEYAERDAVRARLLSLRAVAERLVDDLDAALADARSALAHAESVGDLRQTAVVQARLAHVLQWRGEYAEADRLYAEAASPELPSRLRAEIHELAGRSAFDQGRYLEAMNHFETSLDLRKGADPELVERIEAALDTITRRTEGGDWGPYPRTADEILGRIEPPRPIRDQQSGLWGYVGAVPPRYAQAQPFADGLAWVRRPETPAWELIDLAGRTVIDASAGYLAAERFAEGLAWVSRDEAGGWYAIDRQNRLIIPGGFDDAKAFHHGLALVKRGGWGVIDRHGRVVVQPRYRAFVTPLVSGGPIEGFTDEGLAVFDAGETFGVVDRTGKVVVPAEHSAVVIHPTAFLIADQYGLWGALDRSGKSLVERKYKEQADVLDQIDRLLSDGRPVL